MSIVCMILGAVLVVLKLLGLVQIGWLLVITLAFLPFAFMLGVFAVIALTGGVAFLGGIISGAISSIKKGR